MTGNASPRAAAAPTLGPTIESLLGSARAGAAQGVAEAAADAARGLAQARAEAAAILAEARADGHAAAERSSGAAIAAAGRTERETILAAHLRAYGALRQGVLDELARHVGSDRGAALLARLEALARERLGPDAVVRPLDDGRIGVRGTAGKRSLEISADRFVEHELAELGDGIAALWT